MNVIEYYRTIPPLDQLPYRRIGATTRRVDQLIQELYTEGRIIVPGGPREHVWRIVMKRLSSEHHSDLDFIKVDTRRSSIEIMSIEEYNKKIKDANNTQI